MVSATERRVMLNIIQYKADRRYQMDFLPFTRYATRVGHDDLTVLLNNLERIVLLDTTCKVLAIYMKQKIQEHGNK